MIKKDNLYFGLLLGFIAPMFGLAFYFFHKFYPTFTVREFFMYLGMEKHQLSGIVSLCLIANAIVFTFYVNKRKDRTARGIFAFTCIYVVAALLLKYAF